MQSIDVRSACSFSSEVLLRILIAGTGLAPCTATCPGVYEYANMSADQWAKVSKRLEGMRSRRLIVAGPHD